MAAMHSPSVMRTARTAASAWNRSAPLPGHQVRHASPLAMNRGPSRLRLLRRSRNIPSQYRNVTTYSTPTEKLRAALLKARQDNPILLPVLFVAALGAVSLLGLMAYDEYTRVAPHYSAYPTAVEQRLRLALHYTHVQPDPDRATTYFTEAVKAVEGTGMDPFSKEAMGVRIRFAEMLEKFGRVKASIEILNTIATDCEEKLSNAPNGLTSDNDLTTATEGDQSSSQVGAFRKALIRVIIQAKVKMSALYESDYMQDSTRAKRVLSDAIGLLSKESTNPPTNAFSEANAAGLTMDEIAAMLSQMGDLFATTGEESNAVQVYLLALEPLRKACNGSRSCKEVQIFSNIASSMDLAMKKPGAQINGKPATKESLAAGRKAAIGWAEQAIATSEKMEEERKDEICESAVLSARMTKADLLLEGGDRSHAKAAFEDLVQSLHRDGPTTLLRMAEEGLKRAS